MLECIVINLFKARPVHVSQYEQVLGDLPRSICRVMVQERFKPGQVQVENKIKLKQYLRAIENALFH